MTPGNASGMQIAFFTFAVAFLAAPATAWLLGVQRWTPEVGAMLDKAVPFLMGGAILLAVPALRQFSMKELAAPIPNGRRTEVISALGLHLLAAFAWAGAVALWYWIAGGEHGLAQRIRLLPTHQSEMDRAFLTAELVRNFVVIGILAPVTEELVFRGLLYRAWEAQWGWVPAMLATSALFAVYHRNFVPTFVGSVIYVCLLRRTGTLWAPILVHSAYNILNGYPLMGQWVFPRELNAPGDLPSWSIQIACLFVTAIALPTYVWMSRNAHQPEPCSWIAGNGPLPR